ncbi:MAG: hypothetical protein ACM34L_10095, partial [Gemmatimonas sp.]
MIASHMLGRRVIVTGLACASALMIACATGGKGSGTGSSATSDTSMGSGTSSRDALTGDDLMNTAAANVYDAIHTLRPEML